MVTLVSPGIGRPRALIIVQNLPVPFDRRVWLECQALRDAGYDVTVSARAARVPSGSRSSTTSRSAPTGSTPRGQRGSASSWSTPTRSSRRRGRRSGRAGEVRSASCRPATHPTSSGRSRGSCGRGTAPASCSTTTTCAPSSTSPGSPTGAGWPTAACCSWSGPRSGPRTGSCSTNESYAEIAITRGRKSPEDVTVVRTGPDPTRLRRGAEVPALRRGRRHLVAYLGVMGPQDGVDLVLGGRRPHREHVGPRRHRLHAHGRRGQLRRARGAT